MPGSKGRCNRRAPAFAVVLSESNLILAAAAVVFTAALISSVAGFAFSALASAPLVRLLEDPVRAVTIMVTCSIAIQAYSVWSLRHGIDWRRLWPFVAAGAGTVPLGVWLLTQTPPALFASGLGAFLVLYGSYLLCRRVPPVVHAGWRADALAGALGGLAGGLAGFPGSFVTLWCGMRGWAKDRQRAVYQPYILLMQLEALACLNARAPWSMGWETVLLYVPAALIAACAGLAIFRRLTNRQFSVTVNALLILSGVALLGGLV